MNEYRFTDLSVGMELSFDHLENEKSGEGGGIEITLCDLKKYQELSGDISPIHVDEDYAKKRGFRGRVCYGMLVSSFYSTLVGTYLPGRYAFLQEAKISMVRPVYVGDRLSVTGTVKELHVNLKRVTIKAHIRNQNGEIVSRAILGVGMSE